MKKLSILLLILVMAGNVRCQTGEPEAKFRGGMLLHTGYLVNSRTSQHVSGVCKGIGGQLNISVAKRFRIGAEGYTSRLDHPEQEGYYTISWGGLLLGYPLRGEWFRPVLGLTLGGGRVRELFFLEEVSHQQDQHLVFYQSYPAGLIVPSISAEYALRSKLTLIARIDYQIALFTEGQGDFASGPRLYLGVLFNRD